MTSMAVFFLKEDYLNRNLIGQEMLFTSTTHSKNGDYLHS